MKHRLQRVNELLKRELGEQLTRECRFSAQLVTIQQVDVTPDLKHAHVYVSIIGTDVERRESMATLHAARVSLQRNMSKRVVLKYTPYLHFKLDEAVERGDRVLHMLDELPAGEDEPAEDEEEVSAKEPRNDN